MKERTAKTKLQIVMFMSLMFIIISLMQLFASILLERPTWVLIVQFFPIPIFVVIAIVIILDLAKQGFMIFQGQLVNRRGNIVIVKTSDGREMKFKITTDQMKEIQNDKDIEIRYYKRTKAVINITNV
ncbi:hypothetical protein [Paenibacillus sp. GCM10012306]|uniref:hypothetical protein n=1 Tax=Paenibacillus sp. GCM10012306 TaxID=3317342 RepID=UPI0036208B4C